MEKWHSYGAFSSEKWHSIILHILKRKIDNYIQDFYKETSKTLLITGARQIGKTYSIRQFGAHFKSFIEVKSGKDYTVHCALANIMESGDYNLPRAVIFNNDNLRQEGRLIYAPIYMVMFLERKKTMLPATTKLIYLN